MPLASIGAFHAMLVLAACPRDTASDRSDPPAPPPLHGALLHRFDSCDDLRGYVADAWVETLLQYRYGARLVYAEGAQGLDATAAGPTDYSTTNVQEEGVDEADIVETDGDFVYVAQPLDEVTIVKSWPPEETAIVGRLALDGPPSSMFLDGDRLAVLGTVQDPCIGGSPDTDWSDGTATRLSIVDVSDRSLPVTIREIDLEGWLTSARRIGRDVYLVLQSDATMPDEVLALAWDDTLGLPEWDWNASPADNERIVDEARAIIEPRVEELVAAMAQEELLPRVWDHLPGEEVDGTALLECTDVYRPAELSTTSVLSIVHLALDQDDGSDVSATGLMAGGWTVYASPENLYVAQSSWAWWSWDWDGNDPTTHIHRFSLDGAGSVYEGSGAVDGWLLNQFSMGEHEGYLRVATTDFGWWWGAEGDTGSDLTAPANNVFVLAVLEGRLALAGMLRGIAPGERIFSVRFLGERGFLVTFEQVDPLFTLDLSDPAFPRVAGTLEVTGYSSYLHPLGENHLLAVGMEADPTGIPVGFAVSLFDVSDFANPKLDARLVIDSGEWSWSEALWDHHAFTFHRGVLAVPIYTYDWDGETYSAFSGMLAVDVDEDAGTLTELGRVDHADLVAGSRCLYDTWTGREECAATWAWMRRSVVLEDNLVSVSDYGMKVNLLLKPDVELARVLFWPK